MLWPKVDESEAKAPSKQFTKKLGKWYSAYFSCRNREELYIVYKNIAIAHRSIYVIYVKTNNTT